MTVTLPLKFWIPLQPIQSLPHIGIPMHYPGCYAFMTHISQIVIYAAEIFLLKWQKVICIAYSLDNKPSIIYHVTCNNKVEIKCSNNMLMLNAESKCQFQRSLGGLEVQNLVLSCCSLYLSDEPGDSTRKIA